MNNQNNQKTQSSTPLILGIDPGTNSAFSLIKLDGRIHALFSAKNTSPDELINQIIKKLDNKRIVLIGCDKTKIPKVVQKIGARFNVKIIAPEHDITTSEKHLLFKEFCDNLNPTLNTLNTHEFDSLVSAFFVLKKINKKLKKAIKRINSNINPNKFLYEVITTNKPIHQIIESFNDIEFEEIKNIKTTNYNIITKIKNNEFKKEAQYWKTQFKKLKQQSKQELKQKTLLLTSKIWSLNSEIDQLKSILNQIYKYRNTLFAVKKEYNFFNSDYVYQDNQIFHRKHHNATILNTSKQNQIKYEKITTELKILKKLKYIVLFEYKNANKNINQKHNENQKDQNRINQNTENTELKKIANIIKEYKKQRDYELYKAIIKKKS